jgi:hypothetical protein
MLHARALGTGTRQLGASAKPVAQTTEGPLLKSAQNVAKWRNLPVQEPEELTHSTSN